ncbi:uncharacterized protein G2W53_033318 [Senna tora]|uniref:Uncharacterized protein n=1 Tax=Senna tora TaxID=362788 RepID=A0A834T1Z8_9FABA|nr:uncharacterized protein G2W53_033318 [Senna tora]
MKPLCCLRIERELSIDLTTIPKVSLSLWSKGNSRTGTEGFRQARYLIEAEEALKDLLDVRSHISDLEAPELRRFECGPLSADEFVYHGRKEINDEDRPHLGIVLVPLPIPLIASHHMHL